MEGETGEDVGDVMTLLPITFRRKGSEKFELGYYAVYEQSFKTEFMTKDGETLEDVPEWTFDWRENFDGCLPSWNSQQGML
jgi:hypothetical protein